MSTDPAASLPRPRPFVGRDSVQERFSAALERAVNTEPGQAYPRFFILDGLSGMGKTDLARRLVAGIDDDFGDLVGVATIDWARRTSPRSDLELVFQLIDVFPRELDAPFINSEASERTYARALNLVEKTRARDPSAWDRALSVAEQTIAPVLSGVVAGFMPKDIPSELVMPAVELAASKTLGYSSEIIQHASVLLLRHLEEDEEVLSDYLAALSDPPGFLTTGLTADLRALSAYTPLVVQLDTCEHIAGLLPFIASRLAGELTASPILWLLSGQRLTPASNQTPPWARTLDPSVDVTTLEPFSREELDELVVLRQGDGRDTGDRERVVSRLLSDTQGIPLLAQAALDSPEWLARALQRDPGQRSQGSTSRLGVDELLLSFAQDLIGGLTQTDRLLLCLLAMANEPAGTTEVMDIATELGIEPTKSFEELEDKVSYIRGGDLHEAIRSLLRRQMIHEPSFRPLRLAVGAAGSRWADREWAATSAAYPDFNNRFRESDVFGLALSRCEWHLWTDVKDGVRTVLKMWLETLPRGDRRAARFLLVANDFAMQDDLPQTERYALGSATALNVAEVAFLSPNTWWYDHVNAPKLLATLRGLSRRLGLDDNFRFLLDVAVAELGLRQGLGGFEISTLIDRLDDLPDYYQVGLRTSLGGLAAQAGAQLLSSTEERASMVMAVAPVDLLRAAIRLSPENPRIMMLGAEAFLRGGDEQAAIQAFQQVLALAPDDAQLVAKADDFLWELGCCDDCLRAYERLVTYQPTEAYLRRVLAFRWACVGDFTTAAKHYLVAAEADLSKGDPDGVRGAWFLLSLSQTSAPDWLPALESLEASTDPWDIAYEAVAAAAAGQEDGDSALESLADAMTEDELSRAKLVLYGAAGAHARGESVRARELVAAASQILKGTQDERPVPQSAPEMVHIIRRLCELRNDHTGCDGFLSALDKASVWSSPAWLLKGANVEPGR